MQMVALARLAYLPMTQLLPEPNFTFHAASPKAKPGLLNAMVVINL